MTQRSKNSESAPSTPTPENTRKRPSAREHRERVAAITSQLKETPSQVALSASLSPLEEENALQRKRKSNCGNDPLACGSLRRQQQLTYERCNLGVESSGKSCLEWARKNVSGIRNDTMGHSQHVRCKVCGWVTHSKGENFCYKHLKECCSKAQQGMEDSSEVANPKSLEEYISEALPCFAAQSNLSTEGFLECVKNLFQEFPPDIHPSEAASILPSPSNFISVNVELPT